MRVREGDVNGRGKGRVREREGRVREGRVEQRERGREMGL